MNLTIFLNEEHVGKVTKQVCGGLATFEDIRSLKVEYFPSGPIGYKVEVILFLGEKYNKQLITIDNVERVVACGLVRLIHAAAYSKNGIITSKEIDSKNLPKPTYEYEESYMEPTNIGVEIKANKYREIKHTTINIYNDMKEVDINILYKVLDASNNAKTDSEKELKFIESGEFKFGKLKQIEEEGYTYGGKKYEEVSPVEKSNVAYYFFKRDRLGAIRHGNILKLSKSKRDQIADVIYYGNKQQNIYLVELIDGEETTSWDNFKTMIKEYISHLRRYENDIKDIEFVDFKIEGSTKIVLITITLNC